MIAFVCPTIDAGGQSAGSVSNVLAGQAFSSVVRRDGSCFGRSTLTSLMFDCEDAWLYPKLPTG